MPWRSPPKCGPSGERRARSIARPARRSQAPRPARGPAARWIGLTPRATVLWESDAMERTRPDDHRPLDRRHAGMPRGRERRGLREREHALTHSAADLPTRARAGRALADLQRRAPKPLDTRGTPARPARWP